MPELPEVETIRRDLEKTLLGKTIIGFDVQDRRLMSATTESLWRDLLPGKTWTGFHRRGKYLIMELSRQWRLIVHLRMTGQLVVEKAPDPDARYRLRVATNDHSFLTFYDQRRFGEVWLLAAEDPWPSKTLLGPDALNELERSTFIHHLKERSTRIQPLLLDQRFIAGIGNIYAQEALFKAAIRPGRSGRRVTEVEANRLFDALAETLRSAIRHRGSTSRDYRDAYGESGNAQRHHRVYQKGGQPCSICRTLLKSVRLGGRGTVFCPHCQK